MELALSTPKRANEALVEFIQWLFSSGEPVWIAVHALLAVQTARRDLKGSLRPAWDSIQSWRLQMPVRSRVPLPYLLLEGLRVFSVLAATCLDTARAGS